MELIIIPDDVLGWSRRGTSDEGIVDRIERSNTVFYHPAADDISLRDKGVSEDVVRAQKGTGRR